MYDTILVTCQCRDVFSCLDEKEKKTYLGMETYTTDEEACVTWVHWGEFHHGEYRRGYDERGAEGEGEDNGDDCGIHDQGQCKRPEKRVSTITL